MVLLPLSHHEIEQISLFLERMECFHVSEVTAIVSLLLEGDAETPPTSSTPNSASSAIAAVVREVGMA